MSASIEPRVILGLTEGRVVHFVPPTDQGFRDPTRHIPAVIVRVWDHGQGTVNLRLLTDCSNDHPQWQGVEWQTSVRYDPEERASRSWHFPERT